MKTILKNWKQIVKFLAWFFATLAGSSIASSCTGQWLYADLPPLTLEQ